MKLFSSVLSFIIIFEVSILFIIPFIGIDGFSSLLINDNLTLQFLNVLILNHYLPKSYDINDILKD